MWGFRLVCKTVGAQLDRIKTSLETESCTLPSLLVPEFGVNFTFFRLVDCFADVVWVYKVS